MHILFQKLLSYAVFLIQDDLGAARQRNLLVGFLISRLLAVRDVLALPYSNVPFGDYRLYFLRILIEIHRHLISGDIAVVAYDLHILVKIRRAFFVVEDRLFVARY